VLQWYLEAQGSSVCVCVCVRERERERERERDLERALKLVSCGSTWRPKDHLRESARAREREGARARERERE